MFNNLEPWQKWTAGIAGSLVLGALGSGLWQRLGDPAYVYLRDGILNIATLGATTYKNAMYREVAKGFHEHASALTFTFVIMLVTVVLMFQAGLIASRLQRKTKLHEKQKQPTEPSPGREKTLRVVARISILLGYATAVALTLASARASYAVEAIGYFEQLKRIDAPYLTIDDVHNIDSKFAQIKTKDDYLAVIDALASKAKEHGLLVPPFSPW